MTWQKLLKLILCLFEVTNSLEKPFYGKDVGVGDFPLCFRKHNWQTFLKVFLKFLSKMILSNMYETLNSLTEKLCITWKSFEKLCPKSMGFFQDLTQCCNSYLLRIWENLPAFNEGRLSLPLMPSAAVHSRTNAHYKRNGTTNVTHWSVRR